MPIDILDQPRGGILETTVLYLRHNAGISRNTLMRRMTGSEDGKEYFERNVIDLLEACGFVEVRKDKVYLKNSPILDVRHKSGLSDSEFKKFFKVQFLSNVTTSKNPNVAYFREALRMLFDVVNFDREVLERILRDARRDVGITVSEGEELRGKVEFCLALLNYLDLISKIGNKYLVVVPVKLQIEITSNALSDIDKPTVKIFNDLMPYINLVYLPVLHKTERRILQAIHRTMSREDFMNSFNFANIPDGGRAILLGNREYNALTIGK